SAGVWKRESAPAPQKTLVDRNKLIELQKKAADDAVAVSIVNGDRIANTTYALRGSVLFRAVVVAFTTTRSITGPLAESLAVAKRVASGDLSSRIESSGRDAAADLQRAVRELNDGLASMVSQIRTGAESIAVGAGQVAAGNQQLS